MKITFTSPNNIPVLIEGTPDEINSTIDRLMGIAPVKAKAITGVDPVKPAKASATNDNSNSLTPDKISNFLNGIYTYPANKNTNVGKARAIAEFICDGKTHAIADVARECNSITDTVRKNISYMIRNNAIIVVDSSTVTVKSVPTKRLPKRRATRRSNNFITLSQNNTPPTSGTSAEQNTSIFSGIQIS
jgi:hypothetical protein